MVAKLGGHREQRHIVRPGSSPIRTGVLGDYTGGLTRWVNIARKDTAKHRDPGPPIVRSAEKSSFLPFWAGSAEVAA